MTEMCADAVAELDSSINRAHQHAAGARRITDPDTNDTAPTDGSDRRG